MGTAGEAIRCALGAVLLCSGVAKLASPVPFQRAIGALVPALAGRGRWMVRALAALESGVAVALVLPPSPVFGASGAVLLGVGFAATGVLGAVRGGVPCGCFGRDRGAPLGARNVLFGLLVLAAGLVSVVHPHPTEATPAVTATLTVLLAGWLFRDLVRDLIRPPRAAAASEVEK